VKTVTGIWSRRSDCSLMRGLAYARRRATLGETFLSPPAPAIGRFHHTAAGAVITSIGLNPAQPRNRPTDRSRAPEHCGPPKPCAHDLAGQCGEGAGTRPRCLQILSGAVDQAPVVVRSLLVVAKAAVVLRACSINGRWDWPAQRPW